MFNYYWDNIFEYPQPQRHLPVVKKSGSRKKKQIQQKQRNKKTKD